MKKERRNGKHTLKSSPSAIGSDRALTAGVRILSVIVIRAMFNAESPSRRARMCSASSRLFLDAVRINRKSEKGLND
jgi:hypothetical protein